MAGPHCQHRVEHRSRKDRGKGFGINATKALLRYAFEHLDLYRTEARIASYNSPAQQVLEKCGFVLEGQDREAFYAAGQRWDRPRYGLLRQEF